MINTRCFDRSSSPFIQPARSPAPLLARSLGVALFCAGFGTLIFNATAAAAQETTAPTAEAPANPAATAADNFIFYVHTGNFPLAVEEAKKLLESQPREFVEALEAVSSRGPARTLDPFEFMLSLQNNDQLKDVAPQLLQKYNDGLLTRKEDPAWIRQNIERLDKGDRALRNGVSRLRDSGELAVPIMLGYLQDQNNKSLWWPIEQALVAMGRDVVNPLVAATEVKNPAVRTVVLRVLGESGVPDVIPYVARVALDSSTGVAEREAANDALRRLGAKADAATLAQQWYDLSEKFYYGKSAITSRGAMSHVWFVNDSNIADKPVSPEIFHDVMAMRAAEYALLQDGSRGDAVSLWLASNYKREAEMPATGSDGTYGPEKPDAHAYGAQAGVAYLSQVLTRTLRDNDGPVSVRAIDSLYDIVGQSNLSDVSAPLTRALQSTDKIVRFKAASAYAQSLPQKGFTGQEQVIASLVEAIAQTGKPGVLVLASSQDDLNKILATLKGTNYGAAGGITVESALVGVSAMPSVDVLLVGPNVSATDRNRLMAASGDSIRMRRTVKVVVGDDQVEADLSRDPLALVVRTLGDEKNMGNLFDAARGRAGGVAVTPEQATQFALRATDLLERLAISKTPVFDLQPARQALLGALDDQRPEIVKGVAGVLGHLNSKEVQTTLLAKASDANGPEDIRIALFKSLATNAKFFNNQLDDGQADTLRKDSETEVKIPVRAAASEAYGALNLPADQVKQVILDQSKR